MHYTSHPSLSIMIRPLDVRHNNSITIPYSTTRIVKTGSRPVKSPIRYFLPATNRSGIRVLLQTELVCLVAVLQDRIATGFVPRSSEESELSPSLLFA